MKVEDFVLAIKENRKFGSIRVYGLSGELLIETHNQGVSIDFIAAPKAFN